MFHQNYPGKAFLGRLILLQVKFNTRLVAMSVPSLSEENSKSRSREEISTDRGGAELRSPGGDSDQAAEREFTEEEKTIHRVHTEACEVTGVNLKTSLKVAQCDEYLELCDSGWTSVVFLFI